jgi:streptogramin lyase
VVAGLDRIWVGEPGAQSLSWINPSTLHAYPSLGVPVVPASLAVTDSSVLAYDGTAGQGAALDPTRQQWTRFHVPAACVRTGACFDGGLAVGGGHVWASTLDSGKVFRLDPVQLTPDGRPTSGVYGAVLTWGLGYLWAYGDRGVYVYQIDPRRDRIVRRSQAGNANTYGALPQIVTGGGQVWILGHKSIEVLDPSAAQPNFVQVHGGLYGAAVSGQWLWVTTGDGRLYQISLFTKKLHHVYLLHHAAAGVAVANNRVWVALDQ